MKFVDVNKMYEIDIVGTVVYETITTDKIWKSEDFDRLHKDYLEKVYPIIKNKKWVKCSDISLYKTSMVADSMKIHVDWAIKNNMQKGCIVTSSVLNKMQIERSCGGKGTLTCPEVFLTTDEAKKWLKSKGY